MNSQSGSHGLNGETVPRIVVRELRADIDVANKLVAENNAPERKPNPDHVNAKRTSTPQVCENLILFDKKQIFFNNNFILTILYKDITVT